MSECVVAIPVSSCLDLCYQYAWLRDIPTTLVAGDDQTRCTSGANDSHIHHINMSPGGLPLAGTIVKPGVETSKQTTQRVAAIRLPDEIVVAILRFLSPTQRGVASQVCKSWYRATLDPRLLRDSVLSLVAGFGGLDLAEILCSNRMRCLHLSNVDNGPICGQLCDLPDSHGRYVVSLGLENCPITFHTFLHCIRVFNGLEKLSLTGCNPLFMAGQMTQQDASLVYKLRIALKRVKSFTLSCVSYLNDDNVWLLLSAMPSLSQLTLGNVRFSYHLENMTRGSILAFSTLSLYLKDHGEYLTSLNLDYTNLNNAMLSTIAAIGEVNLSSLSLVGCHDVTDIGLIPFLQSQTRLHHANLSLLNQITVKSIHTLELCCKSLEVLKMRKCTSVIGHDLHLLATLPIRVLDVSECCRLDQKSLSQLLVDTGITTLREVTLDYCIGLDAKFLVGLCEKSPDLTRLSLCSFGQITGDAIGAIASLAHLQELKIAWSSRLTDFHIMGVSDQLSRGLQKNPQSEECENSLCCCNFSCPPYASRDCSLYTSSLSMSRLSQLTSLDLTACSRLTDLGVCHALLLPALVSLSLSMCPRVTDLGVKIIASRCPSIEHLDVGYTACSDDGVKHIATRLKLLRKLCLSSCAAVTDTSIGYLEAFSFHLRELDVSLCPGITMEQLSHFQRTVSTVHSIKSRFISSGNYIDTTSHG